MSRARRPRRRLVVLLLLSVVLLGGAAWLAYFSPLLVVRQVAVSGQHQLRAEQILAAAQVPMALPRASGGKCALMSAKDPGTSRAPLRP